MKNLKYLFTSLIAAFFLFISCSDDESPKEDIPCIPSSLVNDVIAFYPFSNGSLNDASGNGQHLTNTTSAFPTTDRNGNPNCAYEFDNLPTSTQFLTTSNTTFLNNLEEFSISLWYMPKDTSRDDGAFESLIHRDDFGPNGEVTWAVAIEDCRRAVFVITNAVWDIPITNPYDCNQEIIVRTDIWSHLVVTFKQSGDELAIYRNSVLQEFSSGIAPNPYFEIGDLFLGKDYTGKLDDVIIFNKKLSQQEVNSLYTMDTCCED